MPLAPRTVAMVILVGLVAARGGAAEKRSLVPPVHLPDGAEFQTWETPPVFAKTYYVDQADPKASDDNPGSRALPLKTINRGAGRSAGRARVGCRRRLPRAGAAGGGGRGPRR